MSSPLNYTFKEIKKYKENMLCLAFILLVPYLVSPLHFCLSFICVSLWNIKVGKDGILLSFSLCLSSDFVFPVSCYLCHFIPLPQSPRGEEESEVLIRWTHFSSRGNDSGTLTCLLLQHPDPPNIGDQGGETHLTHSLEALALQPRHSSKISPSCLCQCYCTDSHQ